MIWKATITYAKRYLVEYDLKYGIKQHCDHRFMEVEAINAKEAVKIVKGEVKKIFNRHAFHCKAKRI